MKSFAAVCLVALALLGTCAVQASAKKGGKPWQEPDWLALKKNHSVGEKPWGSKPWGDKPKFEDHPWYNKDWETKKNHSSKWDDKPGKPYDPNEWKINKGSHWTKGLSAACAQGYWKFQAPIVYIQNNDLLAVLEVLLRDLSAFNDIPNFQGLLSNKWFKDTLLAPTNDAFVALAGSLAIDLSDPTAFAAARFWLSNVLQYHVVAGDKPTKFLKTGSALTTAYPGHYIYWQTKGNMQPKSWNKLSWPGKFNKGPLQFVDEQNSAIPVVCPDIKAGKGLIDVVNEVALASDLYPTVVAAAQAAGLTTLLSIASAYPQLISILESSPGVLFAPTNQAFANVPNLGSLTPEQVLTILTNHAALLPTTDVVYKTKPSVVTTVYGQNVTLVPNGATPTSLTYNEGRSTARILGSVLFSPLARIFVVDSVLVPLLE